MTPAAPQRDWPGLLAAYSFTGSKLLAWLVAAAIVWRGGLVGEFAALLLIRSTLALLNYTTFGLAPAALKLTAAARNFVPKEQVQDDGVLNAEVAEAKDLTLEYASPIDQRRWQFVFVRPDQHPSSVVTHVLLLAALVGALALLLGSTYSNLFPSVHDLPSYATSRDWQNDRAVWYFGIGITFRLIADLFGAVTQGMGRFAIDQWLAAVGEIGWVAAIFLFETDPLNGLSLNSLGFWFAMSGVIVAVLRFFVAVGATEPTSPTGEVRYLYLDTISPRFLLKMLAFGGLVTLGQAADFLYAPIDYLVINRLIGTEAVATYGVALQVDAGLLVLAGAVSTFAFARFAALHSANQSGDLWQQYLKLTKLATGVALGAAVLAWLLSPIAFRLWLGQDVPAARMILPAVLVHTVLGSAAGVGRAAFLAIGRPGTYAISVLLGGALNVGLSIGFVLLGLGLWGVIFGTILSVAVRCAAWMPWYLRRHLTSSGEILSSS